MVSIKRSISANLGQYDIFWRTWVRRGVYSMTLAIDSLKEILDMKTLRTAVALAFIALMAGCGGSDASTPDSQPPAAVGFNISYLPTQSDLYPAGSLQVSPPTGSLKIADGAVTKVDFLLFGYDAQQLVAPNFQPKDNPQLRYVFRLPETYGPNSYVCGSGRYLSEVRVTTPTGITSKTFEICPGTSLQLSAP